MDSKDSQRSTGRGTARKIGRFIAVAICAVLATASLAFFYVSGRLKAELARELGDRTGLAWTIGRVSICLQLRPCVELRDVEAGGPTGVRIKINKARISTDWAVASQRAGEGRVSAETITFRMPTVEVPMRADSSARGLGGTRLSVFDARVTITDAVADVHPGDNMLSGSAGSIDLQFLLEDSPSETSFVVDVQNAGYFAKLDGKVNSNFAGEIGIIAGTRAASDSRIVAKAAFSRTAEVLEFANIVGSLGDASFSGHSSLAIRTPINLSGEFKVDRLAVSWPAPGATSKDGFVQSIAEPLDVFLTNSAKVIDADVSVDIGNLTIGKLQCGAVKTRATVRQDIADIASSSASLYGGVARLRYVRAPSDHGGGRVHQLSLYAGKVQLRDALMDLAQVNFVDGTTTARIEAQSLGDKIDAVVAAASGVAEISIANGSINGLGIAQTAGALPVQTVGGDAIGALAFDRMGGTFALKDGHATTSNLHLNSRRINATGAGIVDYSARSLNITFKPSIGANGKSQLGVPVRVYGPWERPEVSADFNALIENTAEAVQSLKEIGQDLLGKDDNGVAGVLDTIFGTSGGATTGRAKK